MSGIIVIIQT